MSFPLLIGTFTDGFDRSNCLAVLIPFQVFGLMLLCSNLPR
ncbi:hypothetical protein RHOER0001_1917 [Rhodococcus erythropolis SK121]|nr:hypothetical protein RHOER0001_1917 [Rhodococcus erythropolis SK121]